MSKIIVKLEHTKSKDLIKSVGNWNKYVSKKESADSTNLDVDILNQVMEHDSDGSSVWNIDGDMDLKKELKTIKADNRERIFWKLMISFDSKFTKEKKFSKNDYYEITRNAVPKFLIDAGLSPSNIEWHSALHVNTNNDHLHILFYEKNPTLNRGKIDLVNIKKLKSNIVNFIINNNEFYKNKDQYIKEIKNSVKDEKLNFIYDKRRFNDKYRRELNKKLVNLKEKLPDNGRLQYNSKNMLFMKEDLNQVVNYILSHESLKYKFENYYYTLLEYEREYVRAYGGNNDYATKQLEVLYSQIANDVLENLKGNNRGKVLEFNQQFLEKNIMSLMFKSSNYQKTSTIIDVAEKLYNLCLFSNLNERQTKKVMTNWKINSGYELSMDHIYSQIDKNIEPMTEYKLFKTLRLLGYRKEKYSKIVQKNFYKTTEYKSFFYRALNHLIQENEKVNDQIVDILGEDYKSINGDELI